ncbi:MAG: hypothetical protein BWY71_01693 [Planctomycetes bacterium ADurb.Bin412]|nr:MAG: hypothetical protein BWY71_01693 [Planctomycetes bacterium ADurb.Bin412]
MEVLVERLGRGCGVLHRLELAVGFIGGAADLDIGTAGKVVIKIAVQIAEPLKVLPFGMVFFDDQSLFPFRQGG